MRYYIDTIEQTIIRDEETGEITGYNEYGGRAIQGKEKTYEEVESAFFTKCANVANDINKNHSYMDIKIVNSDGGILKKDKLGTYVNNFVYIPPVTPTPEPEENIIEPVEEG